jgi:hypothetical protein
MQNKQNSATTSFLDHRLSDLVLRTGSHWPYPYGHSHTGGICKVGIVRGIDRNTLAAPTNP